ncbi:MAG: hypothetical protein OEZ54_11045 [Gemmatimonadota bacterium]|nr:hypothetical protein [Gemmatimonadota bacterium]
MGSTYGPISEAVRQARSEGHKVSHIHIRYLIPLPKNLGALLGGFETVMVAEMNAGQLVTHIRSTYAIDAKQLNKVTGKPFKVAEISDAIHAHLEAGK